jgi:hypothetical protein
VAASADDLIAWMKKKFSVFFLRAVRRDSRRPIQALKHSPRFSESFKSEIVKYLRHHYVRYTTIYIPARAFLKSTAFVISYAALVLLILLPISRMKSGQIPWTDYNSAPLFAGCPLVVNGIAILFIYLFVIIIIYLLGRYTSNFSRFNYWPRVSFWLYFLLFVSGSVILSRLVSPAGISTPFLSVLLPFCLIAAEVIPTAFAALVMGYVLINKVRDIILMRRYPDSFTIDGMIQLVYFLGEPFKYFLSLKERARIMRQIDALASIVEKYFLRYFNISDAALSAEMGGILRAAAAAMRHHSLMIEGGDQDKIAEARDKFAKVTLSIAKGNYFSLEQRECTQPPLKKRIKDYILDIVKTLFIAASPLAVFLATFNLGLELDAKIRNFAMIGAVAWAILTLLNRIDPTFDKKINATKDIMKLP